LPPHRPSFQVCACLCVLSTSSCRGHQLFPEVLCASLVPLSTSPQSSMDRLALSRLPSSLLPPWVLGRDPSKPSCSVPASPSLIAAWVTETLDRPPDQTHYNHRHALCHLRPACLVCLAYLAYLVRLFAARRLATRRVIRTLRGHVTDMCPVSNASRPPPAGLSGETEAGGIAEAVTAIRLPSDARSRSHADNFLCPHVHVHVHSPVHFSLPGHASCL